MLILFVATRWLPAAATLLVVLFLTFPTMKIDLLLWKNMVSKRTKHRPKQLTAWNILTGSRRMAPPEKGTRKWLTAWGGYKKAPDDKQKWLIDEQAAEAVRKIFSLCFAGRGPSQIARQFEGEKVLVPTVEQSCISALQRIWKRIRNFSVVPTTKTAEEAALSILSEMLYSKPLSKKPYRSLPILSAVMSLYLSIYRHKSTASLRKIKLKN